MSFPEIKRAEPCMECTCGAKKILRHGLSDIKKERCSRGVWAKALAEKMVCLNWEDFTAVKEPTTCLIVKEKIDGKTELCFNCLVKMELLRVAEADLK